MGTAANSEKDYAEMMLGASTKLRTQFDFEVGEVVNVMFGVAIVLVGKHCNIWMHADHFRERDFTIALVPAGLNTDEAISNYRAHASPRIQKYLQEVVRESTVATDADKKRIDKLVRFWSWRDFFFNDVPASHYHAQFEELCDYAIKFCRPYLTGQKAITD